MDLVLASSTTRDQSCYLMRSFDYVSASQMVEKSDDNTVNSLCEASLNLSHDTLCSGKTF